MTIQSVSIDPNAVALTDNQIVDKINSATNNITRASCVSTLARPLEDEEVTAAKVAAGVAKDNLDAMAATERGYVATNPAAGQYVVTSIERSSDGKIKFDYDEVPKA
jgi:hypothetical protein